MNETTAHSLPLESPYVGLMPYEERHAPLFFGRDTDREKIIATLRAARLTIFYGPSGVGKSSVLRAGVIHHLRQRAWPAAGEGAPEFAVVYYKDWTNDPIQGLATSMEEGIRVALPPDEPFEPIPSSNDLTGMLAAWTERFGMELLIILDQFEEYFLYRAAEAGPGTFADAFPRAVNRRDLPVRFLISLREDALSKLDCFKGRIPTLFETRLQIGHLHDNDARAAISEPIPAYNTLHKLQTPGAEPYGIEQQLVEAVLEQVSGLKLKLGSTGQGTVSGQQAQYEIETPYLQLVMTRLWQEEQKTGSRQLRWQTLNDLGCSDHIIRDHLDIVMQDLSEAEQERAAVLFKYLVTPVGSKIAHAVASLVEYTTKETECTQEDVLGLLKKLEAPQRRILYPIRLQLGQSEMDGYQIFHDALAPAILAWRTNYLIARDKRLAEAKVAKVRKHAWLIGTAWLMIVITVGGASVFYYQRAAITEEAKLNVVEGLASRDAGRQKEALDKLAQLKRQGTDLSAVKPLVEDLAQQQGSTVELTVKGVLSARSSDTPPPPAAVQLQPRVYIHIQDERQRGEARQIEGLLEQSGFAVPGIELVRKAKLARNELRYFRDEDKEPAKEIVKVLQPQLDIGEPKRITGYENSPYIRPQHYELWFKAAEDRDH
jgi:hypothetical protein